MSTLDAWRSRVFELLKADPQRSARSLCDELGCSIYVTRRLRLEALSKGLAQMNPLDPTSKKRRRARRAELAVEAVEEAAEPAEEGALEGRIRDLEGLLADLALENVRLRRALAAREQG
jgi:hypothetical protein